MFESKHEKLEKILKVFKTEGAPEEVLTTLLIERDVVMNILKSHGVQGSLTDCVQAVLRAASDQHETIMQANLALKESEIAITKHGVLTELTTENQDDMVYSYFVSYDATYKTGTSTDQAPSLREADMILMTAGQASAGESRCAGMTVVNVEGGIRNWQNVVGISHFISKNTFKQFNDVSVVIRHFEEINRWKKETK